MPSPVRANVERVFITGASRGIGAALARRYLEHGAVVFAGARRKTKLESLRGYESIGKGRLVALELDVTDGAAIERAVDVIRAEVDSIDVLVNNAGTKPPSEEETFESIDAATMSASFATNVTGPLMVSKALIPLLERSSRPRIVNISSQLGAIGWPGGGYYAYCTSKAALNMVTRRMAQDLESRGITTIAMHPGWVRTDMGGPSAPLTTEESVAGIMDVVASLDETRNGRFLQWNGEPHPW